MTSAQPVLGIETTRYSAVVGRILEAYQSEVIVRIDGRMYQGPQIDVLRRDWCTNRNITSTFNFEVIRGDVAIFGYHDHPDELWAASSEEGFVASLANERLLRFRKLQWVPSPSLSERFSEVIRRLFGRSKRSSNKASHSSPDRSESK